MTRGDLVLTIAGYVKFGLDDGGRFSVGVVLSSKGGETGNHGAVGSFLGLDTLGVALSFPVRVEGGVAFVLSNEVEKVGALDSVVEVDTCAPE